MRDFIYLNRALVIYSSIRFPLDAGSDIYLFYISIVVSHHGETGRHEIFADHL